VRPRILEERAMKQVTMRLPDDLYEKLTKLAHKHKQTTTTYIRAALGEYVHKGADAQQLKAVTSQLKTTVDRLVKIVDDTRENASKAS
jgi:predicted DNA-binding protein